MGKIIKYNHHGIDVFVDEDLKGKHRGHCLCWQCGKFVPDDIKKNCPIASLLFRVDILAHITTPVYECKEWVKPKEY